jgi:hypothetical protein
MTTQFAYRILGCESWDFHDDNIDVEIDLSDGKRYSANVFTISNIRSLMDKNKSTGECSGGLYMWSSHMILVEKLDPETIRRTIEGLVEDEELDSGSSGNSARRFHNDVSRCVIMS